MMKRLLILAAVCGLAACAQPQDEDNLPENVMITGTNPIISNQFTADPTARVFNGRLYLYPSHDLPSVITHIDGSAWFSMEDYHVFSTDDLRTWTDHGVILRQEDVPWGKKDAYSMWAPDCVEKDGQYYFYFPDARAEGGGFAVGVAVSDKPEGPYSKPVCLEVDDIDPSHFVDDDGKRYMIIAKAAKTVPLSEDSLSVAGDIKVAWDGTGERCSEGPHMLKKDGYYYAMVAEGGTGYGHGINMARSKELYGEYENSPYNPVMRQLDPTAPIQRAGHGKLVQDQNGQWWCYYLCGRPNQGNYTTIGRESALDPVQWTEDGWFTINNGK